MILYRASLGIAPVSKKNSQRIVFNQKRGVHFVKPSAAYERYERDALRLLRPLDHPISSPVNVKDGLSDLRCPSSVRAGSRADDLAREVRK